MQISIVIQIAHPKLNILQYKSACTGRFIFTSGRHDISSLMSIFSAFYEHEIRTTSSLPMLFLPLISPQLKYFGIIVIATRSVTIDNTRQLSQQWSLGSRRRAQRQQRDAHRSIGPLGHPRCR